jgi:hypothetical protein
VFSCDGVTGVFEVKQECETLQLYCFSPSVFKSTTFSDLHVLILSSFFSKLPKLMFEGDFSRFTTSIFDSPSLLLLLLIGLDELEDDNDKDLFLK